MPVRRMPQMGAGPAAAMAGGMAPGGRPGGGGGMRMPRPAMTGAPTGNANPNAMNGIPMAPPPIDPSAGGPTSPFNIDQMLKTNQGNAGGSTNAQPGSGPQQPVRRTSMPPWGDSQGKPTMDAGTGASADPTMGGAAPTGVDANDPSQGPLVMLRLLKAMGKV